MRIVYSEDEIRTYMKECTEVAPGRPILLDRFLEDATEVDVDCVSDGKDAVIGAVMEHIEQAGIDSGDSACVIASRSVTAMGTQSSFPGRNELDPKLFAGPA